MLLYTLEQWDSLEDTARAVIIFCLCINIVIWSAMCYMLSDLDEPKKKKYRVNLAAMLRNLKERGHEVGD